jgi:hypothetical protein
MHHKYYNNNVIIEYNMIICSSSNIDIIQGNIGYNDPEGITDWRITNTASGSSGTLNILNSLSQTGRVTILDNGNLGIANTNPGSLLDVGGDINITGIYKRNNRDIISDTSNYALSTSNILVLRILTEVGFGSNYTSRLNTALNTRIDNTSNYVLATSNLLANRVSSQWTSVSSGVNYSIVSAITEPTLIPSRGYVNGSLIGEGIPVLFYRTLTFTYNQDNIVAYYKFNDSSSLGLDSNPSSTKYNLTPTIVGGTGGYNTIVGVEGSSFQATNDGDRLEGDLPLKSIFDSSVTGISICCWFYKKLATYDNIYNTQLFTFHNPSSTNQWVTISLSHYNNVYKTNFSFSYTSGETYSSGFGPILAFDTWYHIVLILTKTGNIKVYFNGVNLTLVSGTTDGNINTESTIRSYGSMTYPLPQCPNTTKLKIFNDQTKFSGNIDEFYIFNKELTQTEINMLYNKKYSVPVNSWNINFPVSNTIMVNNTSKNVSGLYTISVGNATSSVLPASGQAIIPLPSTATTTITIKYPTQYITVANPYTYQVFTYTTETAGIGTGQTQYTFNAPSGGILCDILLVGGGGAGSGTVGGGGGAGALIFVRNAVLNGTYNINVGNGGTGGMQAQGTKGYSSIISQGSINITAEGGGASGRADGNQNGGSGGGGDYWEGNQSGGTSTSYTSTAFGASIIKYGNNGANAYTPSPFNGGGGGGAGSSALIATSTNLFSNGGSGLYQVTIDGITINFATHFGTNTAQVGGVLFNGNLYYGGGGGAGGNLNSTGGSGGLGGGGDGGPGVAVGGANIPIHGSNGFPNTGGGGGGGSNHPSLGGNGGSGIVIIRYLSPTNVGIGTTTPVTELHVYDDTTNNTTLTVQNNYIDPVVIYPNTVQSISLPEPLFTTNPTGVSSGIIDGTDRYYIFTHTGGYNTNTGYANVPIPNGITFDLLMIGGGGAGGGIGGSGGGSGACLVAINQTLPAGTYTFTVGGAGSGGITGSGNFGHDTFIGNNLYKARGGGGGAADAKNGIVGGCSGGAAGGVNNVVYTSPSPSTDNYYQSQSSGPILNTSLPYSIYANKGGDVTATGDYDNINYGGGGGIGAAAANANTTTRATPGGDGLYQVTLSGTQYNLRSYFTNNGTFGVKDETTGYYFIGGGGGAGGFSGFSSSGRATAEIAGGKGGGGIGKNSYYPANGTDGFPNTGSGGGGGSTGLNGNSYGGNGGSGLLIFRYRNTVGYTATETLESSKFYRTLTFNYFANYPENPPNTALLAWYRFDGDGLDYNPYATKYNLIANSGTPTYSSGTSADSFFQGRRYINTSTGSLRNTSLSLNSRAFSIALWMRTKNSSVSFFIAQTSSIGGNTALHIGQRGNNAYSLDFYGNNLDSVSYAGDINTWVHIVYVVLPNYNRRLYRNGIQIAADSNTSAFSGSGDLRIGADYSSNASQNVDISDFRIYNNGLSATDVATLYNSYTSLVITDNYAINFNKPSTVLVNSVSKTVNGLYNISMGHINSSMLPATGQADTPLASTATRSVAIKYEYSNTSTSLPNLITVAGATSSIIGTTERAISFTYTSDSSGLTGQTQYSFTPTEDLWCDILVVGGGGGGGHGGGGGGGVLFGTNLKINAGVNVSVKVGNGGAGTTGGSFATAANGTNGFNSSITINSIEYIAVGGGGGGTRDNNGSCPGRSGNTGGSGGGGSHGNVAPYGLGGVSNKNNYANFQSFGNNGGIGRPGTSGSEPNHTSGGGGGAGSVGNDISYTTGGGNGGQGKDFVSYFGTNVGDNGYFGGGGGGQTAFSGGNRGYGNGGLGLYGGGGNSANEFTPILLAHNGLSNTGGGGGGGRFQGDTYTIKGGNGGSGFIIIRYRRNRIQSAALELIRTSGILPTEIIVTGTTSATISGTTDRYISFPYSGTGTTRDYSFTTTEPLICDILVVGGGGGGGKRGGAGGGAGALLYHKNVFLNIATFAISVGKGGLHGGLIGQDQGNSGSTGSDSSISIDGTTRYLAKGGGGGQGDSNDTNTSGGSSGGGTWAGTQDGLSTNNIFNGSVVSVVNNQYVNTLTSPEGCRGNIGGNQLSNYRGGGGGGAGSAGMNHNPETTTDDGYGGLGLSIDITGIPIVYAGGGNGSDYSAGHGIESGNQIQSFNPVYPTIESRGGGGYASDSRTAESGLDGTGGGGGGQGTDLYGFFGGSGGSGIVIIRYRKANTNYKIGNYGGDFKIISSTQSGDTDYMRITRDGTSIYNPTGSPQWSTTSDRRIKENIEKASYTKCYDNINKLELYRFNYIKDFNNINKDLRQLGYIAQEVNDIFPKAVTTQHFNNQKLSVPDLLTIDITQINYSLYGAVKKLIELYNDIGKKINVLEKLLNIDTSASDLIIADEISTSNIIITEASTSNLTTDTSNLIITDTSNVIINDTSNVIITESYTSNLTTDTSNVIITEVSTSNLITDTSNVIITEASTSNVITDTSNVIITESSTNNLTTDTSNVIITEASTSNITTDTINVIITEASTSNLTQDAS